MQDRDGALRLGAIATTAIYAYNKLGCGLTCAILALSGLFVTVDVDSARAVHCPKEEIRVAQGMTALPACMALEMASPPKKFGQEAGVIGAFSPDGTKALYKSKAALAGTEGLQSFIGDNYVATLTAGGWSTAPTSPPTEYRIAVGGRDYGGAFAFAPDLGSWAIVGATQAQQYAGEGQFFTGELGGSFSPLSPPFAAINDTGESVQFELASLTLPDTAADLSATVFSPFAAATAYLPLDPRGSAAGGRNSYVAFIDASGDPALELLARDKDGVVYGGRCGSQLGGGGANQGAISPEGSRIYFSTRPAQPPAVGTAGPACEASNPLRPLRIFERNATPAGPVISELIPGEPEAPGDDLFQGASVDGSKVFLASPRKLTASDQDASAEACSTGLGSSKGCDLYLYDAELPPGSRLIQASVGGTGDTEPGKGADVLTSTVAISTDGSRAYFVAQGVLTTDPNPEGDFALPEEPNLYLYERNAANPAGRTAFIGTLATGDEGEVWGSASFQGDASAVPLLGPEGGDGHVLLFASEAPLTEDDTDTGLSDVFRYDASAGAAGTLQRISKAAPGGSEEPAADVGVNPNESSPSSNFSEQGRWVSEDGQTVAFATEEPLAPGAEEDVISPYIYKEGTVARLPGEVDPGLVRYRPVVSAGGEMAGFTSYEKLVPQDGDTAADAYIARVNGGFLPPLPPALCNPLAEGSCQGPPAQSALNPSFASGSFTGPGNVKQKPRCKKGKVRKKGKCVKKQSKAGKRKQGKRGGKANRAADKSQGGSK